MIRATTLLLAFGILAAPVQAEVLLIDAISQEPANSSDGLARPVNWESMQAVEARFGKPQASHGPVGDPAIVRWDYPGYSVYFEFDRVLTSVVHRTPPE